MFEVNGVYANRNGKYTVLAVNSPKMSVRYEDGTHADLNMRVQGRIWENIIAEQEIEKAKAASRSGRKGAGQTRFFIKAVSIPDVAELMFPGWQENVIMADAADVKRLKSGSRIIYYAIEPQTFFAVATVTGQAFEANPKDYFFAGDRHTADFFPVDMDAFASTLEHGIRSDSVELESYPHFKTMTIRPQSFLEINEDDFELLAEILTEVSEDELDELATDEYEEEEEEGA